MSAVTQRYYDPSTGAYIASGIDGLYNERAAVQHFDDFLGDTLNADLYATDLATGATIAIEEQQNGAIRFTLDTDDDDHATLAGALNLKANTAGWLEVRLKQVTAATLRAVEVGISDAKSETNGLAFSALATPAAVADDAAVFAYNTDDDTAWYLASVKGGGTPQATRLDETPSTDWQTLRLEWTAGGAVSFFIDGERVGTHENAVTTTVAMGVWITLKSLSGAAKSMDVDYIAYAYNRS